VGSETGGYESVNPYASPKPDIAESPADRSAAVPPAAPRRWPIIVSAAIFAGMHYGHGYDFVALFFLALGLGYVYQQTHRVVPCIVIHLLLNAGSLVMLWLSVTYGGGM
jgi:membrane protease YdiL (CAAX protease family)